MAKDDVSKMLRKEKRWNKGFPKHKIYLQKFIRKSKNHLDFGCGFGYFAYLLAKNFPQIQVTGIDVSNNAIRLGKKKYKRKNLQLKREHTIKNCYDSITAIDVVHHLTNPSRYLRHFYEHLNDKGYVLIHDFRKVSRLKFRPCYEAKKAEGRYESSFEVMYKRHCRWTPKQFSAMAKKAGFKQKYLKTRNYNFIYVGQKR